MANVKFNNLRINGRDDADRANRHAGGPLDQMPLDVFFKLVEMHTGCKVVSHWDTIKKNPETGMSPITKVNKSTIKFTRDLRPLGEELWDVTITRTANGFHYHDEGSGNLIDIDFETADRLIWEFEYPKSLKKVLKHLKRPTTH